MSTHNRRRLISWVPVVIWMCCIFYVSSYPTARVVSSQDGEFVIKKSAHIIEYAILAALTYRALRREGFASKKAGIYAILFAFFYGMTDEIHERFVYGRESRFRDVAIDAVGASLSIYSIWKLLPIAPMKLKNWARKWELI